MRGTKGKKRLAAFLLAVVMMLTYSPEGAAMAAEAWKEKGSFQLISVNPKQNPAAADLQEEGKEETGEPETQTEEAEEAEEPGQQIQENPVLTLEEREEERLAVVRAELEALVQQGFSADAFAPFLIIDNEGEESAFLESEASDSGNPLKIDEMVLAAQQWLNETYTGQHGYTPVEENGKTGNNVVRGLITALQIELGIAEPTGTFGPTTASLCPTLSTASEPGNIVKILQYGLYCKGYQPRGATGTFGEGTEAAIMKVQTDAGLEATGIVDPVLFKAVLNTDALVLIAGGDVRIRAMQQNLNRKYLSYIGIMPCDGVYARQTNKALIYALQAEEGMAPGTANGNFGPSTTELCPTLSQGDSRTDYVYILQYALYCNGYDPGAFDGVYDSQVSGAVCEFQEFMCLPVTGVANMSTIKSLLCSSGDTDRPGTACDCATILTAQKAKTLKDNGYEIVGRYLTGTVGGTTSKAITREEAQIIFDAGLRFFPIYQDGGYYLEYFTPERGNGDALKAIEAAQALGLPKGTIIYFAVDFDAYDYQVTDAVLPYFAALSSRMKEKGSPYKIGVYGPRNICTRVCENHYAVSSFVADMSTGYSGNLGYRMPSNWAFDQIREYTIGSGTGAIAIDKDIASGRDRGVGSLDDYSAGENTDPPVTMDDTYWADPVDISSGSHVISHDILTITGAQSVKFTLSYHSGNLAESEAGIGWYHNFQKRLEIGADEIRLYQTPAGYLIYEPSGENSVYTTQSTGRQNSRLKRQADGSYRLENGVESVEYFDSQGRYTAYENHVGMQIQIQYPADGTVRILEPISQDYILLTKNSAGRIASVQDQGGRSASFEYDSNGFLTKIHDLNGNTLTYTYSSMGKILTGTDGDNVCYFTNTYDEMGRVVSQRDGIAGSSPTLFSYDDSSTDGRLVVEVTNRNGKKRLNIFNSSRQLIQVTDENGNTTSYTYDENGNVTCITDGEGNRKETTYNAQNQPLTATDARGNITANTYDENGNITKITWPGGASASYVYDEDNRMVRMTDARGLVTSWEYDTQGLLIKKTEGTHVTSYTYENGRVKTVTDPLNRVSTNTYNDKGQLVRSVDSLGNATEYTYDGKGKVVSITNSLNHITRFLFDCRDALISSTDARGNTSTYTYNGNGMLTAAADAKGGTTVYEYDGEDRRVKTTDAAGNVTRTTYDDGGRVTVLTDALGNRTTYEYDRADRLIKETDAGGGVTVYTYDADGNILTKTDAAGNTTSYEYNAASLPVKVTNAMGGVTVNEYNAANDLIKTTDPNGGVTTYTYDSYGNRTGVTDPNGNHTSYTYDACKNLIQMTDALGQVTLYTYDAGNRLTGVTDAKGHTTSMEYDALGRVVAAVDALGNRSETEYDANGNIAAIIDPLGNRREMTYDALNQVTKTKDALGNEQNFVYNVIGLLTQQTDELGMSTSFSYDARGLLTQAVDALGGTGTQTYNAVGAVLSVTGPGGATVSYQYDTANRLISQTTPSGGTVEYGYNALNLQSELTNARGQERTYTYDAGGRITGYTSPEGNGSYTYDANGNVLTASDQNGTVTRTYDACNRVTSYTDVNGNVIVYTYDAVGNLHSIRYPDQSVVTYTYDDANRLTLVVDWSGRMTSYTYDAAGNLLVTSRSDGSVLKQVYDANGRLVSMTDTKADGSVISEYHYTYNAKGLLTTETAAAAGKSYTMTYDELGRVLSRTDESVRNSRETFTYDAAGNITSFTKGVESGTMEYDANNRLISYDGTSITYDADGNMTLGVLGGSSVAFQYDSANRLIGAGSTSYSYDVEGNRIGQQSGGQQFEYIHDTTGTMSRLLMMKTQSGAVIKYVYGNGLIAQENTAGYFSCHYDMRGSTIALTNAAGDVTDTWTYDTYGAVTNKTGRNAILFQYNGRDGVATDENGLLYMRARYYSPQMKRFINADVLSGTISRSTTLNRYAYVEGNPISYVDPFGLSAEPGSNWVSNLFQNIWGKIQSLDGHDWLDLLGMVLPPGVGDSFDAINAIWYLMEGDLTNAAWSAVAFIPVIGGAAGASKFLGKTGKHGGQAAEIIAKYGSDVTRWMDDIVERIRNISFTPRFGPEYVFEGVGSARETKTLGELIDSFKSWIKKAVPDGGQGASGKRTLYHYTSEDGMEGIVSSQKLNPSLLANNPKDCFYGEGQYLSDIIPGTKTPAQLSRSFIHNPFQGNKYSYYIEIDITDLDVTFGRDNVFVILNQEPLDLTNRIISFGKVGD